MNTAKQAMKNREYLRGLLDEKQAGFAASAELGPVWRSGAALRGLHCPSSADTGRRLK
jgi:hypothetical protein